MPELDGLQTMKRLTQESFITPVVVLTANAMEKDKIECLDAGFSDFTTKPINRIHIAEILNRFLNK